MKNAIKLITPLVLMFLFAVSGNAQTTASKVKEGKECDPKACAQTVGDVKNCDPKLCNTLMPQCNKGTKTAMAETPTTADVKATRVAAATAERTISSVAGKPACVSTEGKKCCAKKGN